jgi:hypothetical protein
MATPSNSPVTITPLLRKGSRDTRLLTVSQASANISGDMGKNCVADILYAVLNRLSCWRDKESPSKRTACGFPGVTAESDFVSMDPGNKSINQNNRMEKAAKIKKVHQKYS